MSRAKLSAEEGFYDRAQRFAREAADLGLEQSCEEKRMIGKFDRFDSGIVSSR